MAQVSVQFGAGAFSAKIYGQPGAAGTVVPLTNAQLGSQDLTNVATASSQITAIIVPANELLVENIGTFAYSSSEAAFSIGGSRYGAKVASQSSPESIPLVFPLNPSNAQFILLTGDANLGTVVRTYCIVWPVGGNTFIYSFNAFTGAVGYEFTTDAEAKSTITLIPQGGGTFGYSFV